MDTSLAGTRRVMSRPFDKRTAVVTGGGRGIGRAIAVELAGLGASVALVARSEDELAKTAAMIRDGGGRAEPIPGDLARVGEIPGVVQQITALLGPVDILINNAAVVWPLGPTADLDPRTWAAAITMNLIGTVTTTLAVLPAMLERRWGRIVNVTSGVAGHPTQMAGGNAYVTSKAALEAHTVNLATELTNTGVSINAYRPGTVDTAMQGWIRDQDPAAIGARLHAKFRGFHEAGTLITPEASARSLMTNLLGEGTGQIWEVSDRP
jgi:NAD(P)-dependent dehydrogenase (short-subunit alcohol dehydrogenase family)